MKHIIPILSLIILIAVLFVVISNKPQEQEAIGSVMQSGEYHSVLTGASSGGSDTLQLRTIPATLGSIIITGTGGAITVYNATTSDVNLRAGATTTLDFVALPAGVAVGTYTFDIIMPDGLLVVLDGTQATSTITFR